MQIISIYDQQLINLMSSEQDWYTTGLCQSCIGITNSQCYCRTLLHYGHDDELPIIMDFISIEHQFPPQSVHLTQSQIQNAYLLNILKEEGKQDESTNLHQFIVDENQLQDAIIIAQNPLPEIQAANRRVTKDNISHKRVSKCLQDVYRTVTGEKVPSQIREQFYHRQDYFIIILTLLERKGKVLQAFQHFQNSMPVFKAKIQEEYKNQVERLRHFKKLVSRYLEAYQLFLEGKIRKSMETAYDYQNMRQRKNFTEALQSLWRMRKDFGLSFEQ